MMMMVIMVMNNNNSVFMEAKMDHLLPVISAGLDMFYSDALIFIGNAVWCGVVWCSVVVVWCSVVVNDRQAG